MTDGHGSAGILCAVKVKRKHRAVRESLREMIVVNGLRACDACRAARAALEADGRAVRLRDLRAEPPGPAEIEAWLARLGPGLLNRRSATWRGLTEADRAGDPVAAMAAHPALIKRPVIADGDALHLGWTPAVRTALGL